MPGEKLEVSIYRGELVMLIERAFKTFNDKQSDQFSSHFQGIRKAFSSCGLDPYNQGCESQFNSYLSDLAKNPILSSLLVNAPNFAVQIDGDLEDENDELIADVETEDKFAEEFASESDCDKLEKFAITDLENVLSSVDIVTLT